MASKKKQIKELKVVIAVQEQTIIDQQSDLFDLGNRLMDRNNKLCAIDEVLAKAQLPGPTLEAWAQQARDLFAELLKIRTHAVQSLPRINSVAAYVESQSGPPTEVDVYRAT